MNVNTAEFQALSSQVEEQRKDMNVLIRVLATVTRRLPEAPVSGPERPHLLVIRGGKR